MVEMVEISTLANTKKQAMSTGASLSHINACPINFNMSHKYFKNIYNHTDTI